MQVAQTPARKPEHPLVALANRLPIAKSAKGWRVAPGGLVTALRPALQERGGSWVGWDGGAGDVPKHLPELDLTLHPVTLSRSQAQGHYRGFSNRTLWPLFHDLVEQPVFDRRWWRAYRETNESFAATAVRVETRGTRPLLWVHDYHLMLLPELLRALYPQSPIAFFLHTPFPAPELFARIPWRAELLRGMLGADVVAFQADDFRTNFVRSCQRILPEAEVVGRRVVTPDGRVTHSAAHPISIDARGFAADAITPEVEQALARLRRQFKGRRVLLGVDRLDYTKGILERLQAIELLLERQPALRAELAFVQIAVPSRGDVHEYKALRRQVDELVGRINGRFTEPGGDVPVHYLFRGVSRDRLLAYYRLADAMLVTPLKDGMNLVAKEFAICQAASGGTGVLVLSEFTGAARELREAVLCNPFDLEGLALRFEDALTLDARERQRRLERLAQRVRRRDVFGWAEDELALAESVARETEKASVADGDDAVVTPLAAGGSPGRPLDVRTP